MVRFLTLFFCFVAVFVATPASHAETKPAGNGFESQVVIIQHMFDNEEYDEALILLNALRSVQKQEILLYKYRGIAYQNMGETEKSIEDLKAYVDNASSPDESTVFMLSDQLSTLKRDAEAEAYLDKSPVKSNAYHFRKGKLRLAAGDIGGALTAFRNVAKGDASYTQSQFYIASICEAQGRFVCAEQAYNETATLDPKGQLGQQAAKKKSELNDKKDYFSLSITAGAEFDTNVTSLPDTAVTDVSKERSYRNMLSVDMAAKVYGGAPAVTTLGISASSNKHMNRDVSAYDYRSLTAYMRPTFMFDREDIIIPEVSYTWSHMDMKKYQEKLAIGATYTRKFSGFSISLPLTWEKRNYLQPSVDAASARDGYFYRAGLRLVKGFGDVTAILSGGFAYERSDGVNERNMQADGSAMLMYRIGKLSAIASYSITDYRYEHEHTVFLKQRADTSSSSMLMLDYTVVEGLSVYLSGSYVENRSNIDSYIYDKNIFGAGVRLDM